MKNTESSDTYPIPSGGSDAEAMRIRASYEDYFREVLNLDLLIQESPYEKETLLGILDLLVDTCCNTKATIRIGGDDKPASVVKSQLMKLTMESWLQFHEV